MRVGSLHKVQFLDCRDRGPKIIQRCQELHDADSEPTEALSKFLATLADEVKTWWYIFQTMDVP